MSVVTTVMARHRAAATEPKYETAISRDTTNPHHGPPWEIPAKSLSYLRLPSGVVLILLVLSLFDRCTAHDCARKRDDRQQLRGRQQPVRGDDFEEQNSVITWRLGVGAWIGWLRPRFFAHAVVAFPAAAAGADPSASGLQVPSRHPDRRQPLRRRIRTDTDRAEANRACDRVLRALQRGDPRSRDRRRQWVLPLLGRPRDGRRGVAIARRSNTHSRRLPQPRLRRPAGTAEAWLERRPGRRGHAIRH